jgi:uncharacterized protein
VSRRDPRATSATCPTCRGKSERATAGKAFPFCSERCSLVDLGRWLSDQYRVPDRGGDGEPPGN